MDWSKAKTILIIAFLITNILLVGVLASSERQIDPTIGEEFIANAIDLLSNKNILVATEIPKITPSLNTVTVEFENLSSRDINENFYDGKATIMTNELGTTSIFLEDEDVTIKDKKRITYENTDETIKYHDLNEKKAEEIALKFLKDRKYDVSDMVLTSVELVNNRYYLKFSNFYKEHYLETSFTNVEVDSRGVASLDRIWLVPLEEGKTPIYINTAPKAILSLLSMEEAYGKTIKDISLCYYFEPEDHDYLQAPRDARRGRTIPAWRVLFEDGYKVIIDNY